MWLFSLDIGYRQLRCLFWTLKRNTTIILYLKKVHRSVCSEFPLLLSEEAAVDSPSLESLLMDLYLSLIPTWNIWSPYQRNINIQYKTKGIIITFYWISIESNNLYSVLFIRVFSEFHDGASRSSALIYNPSAAADKVCIRSFTRCTRTIHLLRAVMCVDGVTIQWSLPALGSEPFQQELWHLWSGSGVGRSESHQRGQMWMAELRAP